MEPSGKVRETDMFFSFKPVPPTNAGGEMGRRGHPARAAIDARVIRGNADGVKVAPWPTEPAAAVNEPRRQVGMSRDQPPCGRSARASTSAGGATGCPA